MNLTELRRNYALKSFSESDASSDPFGQFKTWFSEAQESHVLEPNAMTLATSSVVGRPTARVVLLKELSTQGFVFFTNYESRKGQNIAENPQAALLFTWLELERQIRIEGRIEKIAETDSLEYFQSRPKSSQIGAWSSPQSSVIAERAVLEKKAAQLSTDFAEVDVLPLPPFWGGYVVIPDTFEFWQGRESRLHDRIQYRLSENNWIKERLAP